MGIVSGQTQFTTEERDTILQAVRTLHPGKGESMKAVLRFAAIEYAKIDLTQEEIKACLQQTQSDSLIEAMCKLSRTVIQ